MKVIRGEGTSLLCIEWGLNRCNQKGCHNPPNTIVSGPWAGISAIALCEEHYQQGNVPGGTTLTIEFGPIDSEPVNA